MNTTCRITGNAALEMAGHDLLTLRCLPNGLVPAGGIINLGQGKEIICDWGGPSLVYVDAEWTGLWVCGDDEVDADGRNFWDYFTKGGVYLGIDEDGVEPLFRDAASTEGEVAK